MNQHQFPRILSAVALATAALLSLGACATGAAASGAEAVTTTTACLGADVPLTDLDLAADPRTVTGPSTACVADPRVHAIDRAAAPDLPATVVDEQGTEVTVADVSRILALDISGSLAATVQGLGFGGNLVGRDSSTGFPEAAGLPLVTVDGHSLAAEAIIGLAPTVVITDTTLGPRDAIGQLRDAGIPVVVTTKQRSLESTPELVAQVAAALGVPDAGAALTARIDAEVAAVRAQVDAVAPADSADRPRVAFLYVRGSAGVYYLFGVGSGIDSLLAGIDAVDVASEIGWEGMRPVTAEALVQAAPDVVLVMTGGLASVGGVDGLIDAIPALAATPAGERRRVVDIDDTDVLTFGPRSAGILDALARAIYAPADSGPAA